MRGIMGGLYRVMEWIMRLSVINVLWVLCASPIFVGILLTLAAAGQMDDAVKVADLFRILALYCGVLAPFLFFPATAAMFTVARKWVMGEVDAPLIKTFFRGYKENYLQSMIGGLFFVLLGTITYLNFQFYLKQSGALSMLSFLFIVFAFVIAAAFVQFFSIMVHFHMKFWQIIKNSFLVSIGNPGMTLFLFASNILIVYVCTRFEFLIVFFMGSLMALASFWNFFRIYDKMKTINDKKKEELLEASKSEGQADDAVVAAESVDGEQAPNSQMQSKSKRGK
jgi:uncharacterized membrane protein YesL